ncbi:response regulator transcription factor [Synechococcus sp. CC9311]|uniref:response regulator transcription factor n=1 Tax=Synechococcus sp. (strain CC9311) TaxID=64471 RepID=UPI001ED94970|nr:response regulator transcription factor [Synechococcus sp. CC9311]
MLLADDEVNIVTLLEMELQAEGFTVVTATDGISALKKLREPDTPVDLALLDWNMAGITGLDICRRLRETDVSLPVIIMTSRDEIDDRIAALETGADDFISKPFNVREVLARVKALIRRATFCKSTFSNEFSSDLLEIGKLALNRAERTCTINGTALILTVREFDLLDCFMRHPRQALSRGQLIQHVWGDDYFGDENVVDVFVRYLRKKLEAGGSERVIQTVRGVGFALRMNDQ